VYQGEHGVRTLKELARTYLTVSQDLVRVMVRVKALYRSWAIPCAGKQVYAARQRELWLDKIAEAGVRRRAQFYYQQLDALRSLRQEVRRDLLAESVRHQATQRLRQIPSIGPIRAALWIARLQTPHRFRSKRQLWAYSGFGIETHDSGEHRYIEGELRRAKKKATVRGLNRNYNPDLKNLFQGAAMQAATKPGPLQEFYSALLAKGIRPEMARLTWARKMAAITLTMWKKGVDFDASQLHRQVACASLVNRPFHCVFSWWWSVGFLRRSVRGRVSVNEFGPVCCGTESPMTRYAPSDNQK
jgi:transposase